MSARLLTAVLSVIHCDHCFSLLSLMSFSSSNSRRISIQSMPAELLARTFELGLLSFSTSYSVFGPSPSRYSQHIEHLSQVCVFWRDVALGNSHLWIHLHITPSTHLPRIMAWVNRSGTQKLHIHIDYSNTRHLGVTACAKYRDIMLCLIPHIDRWAFFSARLSSPWVCLIKSYCSDLTAPHLTVAHVADICHDGIIAVRWPDSDPPPSIILPFGIRSHIPNLKTLVLAGISPQALGLGFYSSITEMTWSGFGVSVQPSWHETVDILMSCPSLLQWNLDISCLSTLPLAGAPVLASNIASLELRSSDVAVYQLMCFLSLPRLRALALDFDFDSTTSSHHFMSCSHLFCHLDSLELLRLGANWLYAVRLYSLLGGLEHLHLGNVSIHFWHVLADISSSAPPLCPSLKSFSMCGLDAKQLVRFFRYRARMGVPIVVSRLIYGGVSDIDDLNWLSYNMVEFSVEPCGRLDITARTRWNL